MAETYCPERGDVVWLHFSPHSGHEQAGERPALVLSPRSYNQKTGIAIFCPITKQEKGYPFEVKIPTGYKVEGVVLSDHVKSLDGKARSMRFCCKLPVSVAVEATTKINTLLEMDLDE